MAHGNGFIHGHVNTFIDQRFIQDLRNDEYELHRLVETRAPIDGFGAGTRVITSEDAPYLNCAYKLQEYAGQALRKYSEDKTTWPGKKQIYREYDGYSVIQRDLLTVQGDVQTGQPLIMRVMKDGHRLSAPESLSTIRQRIANQLEWLREELLSLDTAAAYQVIISDHLKHLAETLAYEVH